jgi:hypothetical protein
MAAAKVRDLQGASVEANIPLRGLKKRALIH